jgi:hypothetical protein
LGKGTKTIINKFKTQGLADNFATFTAYANDDGYEHVFSKQLENVLKKGDVVVCISASGNSQNFGFAEIWSSKSARIRWLDSMSKKPPYLIEFLVSCTGAGCNGVDIFHK